MAEKFPYEDIVNLPPYKSTKYPPPSMMDRAARFAPFAAITGYEDLVMEEARITEERVELDEDYKRELDEKLHMLMADAKNSPMVSITYYQPDARKKGGAYVDAVGVVKKVDACTRMLLLTDGRNIRIDDICRMEIK